MFLLWRVTLSFNNRGVSEEKHRINKAIISPKIRLVDSDGNALGIVNVSEAQKLANERGLDLVEVSPQADPPVCKILDYGKLCYDLQKKKSEAKKKQKIIEIKEIKFTPMIGANDMKIKFAAIRKFIMEGNKVKASLRFRGREISHQNVGERILLQVIDELKDIATPENKLKLEGKQIFVTLTPLSTK